MYGFHSMEIFKIKHSIRNPYEMNFNRFGELFLILYAKQSNKFISMQSMSDRAQTKYHKKSSHVKFVFTKNECAIFVYSFPLHLSSSLRFILAKSYGYIENI